MKPERWQQIETLYHAARARKATERAAFLAEACADDSGLHAEVEALLRADEVTRGIIDGNVMEQAARLQATTAPLQLGQQLGAYKILALLGKGGMGEVYRAHDTRLDRDVAIKVLPAALTTDPDRLSRFAVEAKATGALNHPNILTVHDVGQAPPELGGAPYLVAELLEGEELRAPLMQGPLPVRKAVDYAQQIVAGLAAAHAKNIVHRDLKPENLFVTKDGRVKILDFGLAKLRGLRNADRGMRIEEDADTLLQPPQANPQLTAPGTVMGTVAYMSPEQVRGEMVDHRSDLFSFGLILFEMLRGERAFQKGTMAETMTAILNEEPPELSESNAKISPALDKIVRRCLEKKPERRFQTASDLGFALEALSVPHSSGASRTEAVSVIETPRSSWRERLAWPVTAAALLLGLLGFAWAYFTRPPITNEARVLKFAITPPENASFDNFALSPDGKWLAFTAVTSGKKQLWVRALEAVEAKLLAGTEGAAAPFWSPDSRFIGFVADGKLKKIEATGGAAQTLCNCGNAFSADWNRDGIILFARGGDLYQVAATGGEAKLTARRDRTREESSYQAPSFLPDGRHFFYYIVTSRKETSGIYLGSLDGQVKERLLGDASAPKYVAAANDADEGWLLFRREGTLLAQPFDARHLKLTGESFSVVERLGQSSGGSGYSKYAVSANGMLVYDSNTRQNRQLLWMDRNSGQARPLENATTTGTLWLAPDGKRFVTDRFDPRTNNSDLWLYDVTGANATRFTFDPAGDFYPLWSPDGSRIIWGSNRKGESQLYQKAVNGTGQEEVFLGTDKAQLKRPTDWSRDGRFFIYNENDPKTRMDIWVWPVADKQPPWPFAATEATEGVAKLSPDGRWLAYVSDETGRFEVYVQRFPERSGKRQVSTDGGAGIRWRRDGKELFYHAQDGKLMVVRVKSGAGFEIDPPVALFEFRRGATSGVDLPSYDVTADGQRFLLNAMVETQTAAPLTVVVNWAAGAKK